MHESEARVITNQRWTPGIQCVWMEERSELSLCPCVTAPRRFTSLPITGGGVYFFKFYPNKQTKKINKVLYTQAREVLILVAFITGNSSLEPLIEGLYAQIHVNLR